MAAQKHNAEAAEGARGRRRTRVVATVNEVGPSSSHTLIVLSLDPVARPRGVTHTARTCTTADLRCEWSILARQGWPNRNEIQDDDSACAHVFLVAPQLAA